VQGNKIAVGNYDSGGKAGTWFFWTDEQLIEVEFTNNKVQDVFTGTLLSVPPFASLL
jgi:hypothetical protein